MLLTGYTPRCQAAIVETGKGKAVLSGFCSFMKKFNPPENIKIKVLPFASYPVITTRINTNLFQKAYDYVLEIKKENCYRNPDA